MKLSEIRKIVRSVIKEAEEEQKPATDQKGTVDPKAEQELKNILKADYPTFVRELGDNIKDPKFQQAIKSIADKTPIDVKPIDPPVSKLKPTQNEIDVDKSLKFPLTNAKSAEVCLKGGNVAIAGKRIVTGGGGKFIIDGHHRWSQLYCMNPKANIAALDISNITDPIAGLKATQLGIAGDIGKVPTAEVKGSNLLKMKKDQVIQYVVKTITPEVVQIFEANGIGGQGKSAFSKIASKSKTADVDKKITADTEKNVQEANNRNASKIAIANYIWKNVEQMQQNNGPVSNAPGRGIMPQTDDAKNWDKEAPNAQAIKESKRLQKLAGILKG